MPTDSLIYALPIGLAIGGLIFVALRGAAGGDGPALRALAVASFGTGFAITWWLYRHPREVEAAMRQITDKGIEILLVALVAALLFWRFRR